MPITALINYHHSSDTYSGGYSSDEFRMYEFKVRKCIHGRSHDWTECPFAHPGEKARRRDPRKYHYSGTACPDFRRGSCPRGDSCEFAHGVFECWLHPARYRTEPCKDGKNCRRKVCFFAHTPSQLRVLPLNSTTQNQCVFKVEASSPTSPLMGICNFSPPISPSATGGDGDSSYRSNMVSHYLDFDFVDLRYECAFKELVNSMESMEISQDTSLFCSENINSDQQRHHGRSNDLPSETKNIRGFSTLNCLGEDQISNGAPDLEWINELVM